MSESTKYVTVSIPRGIARDIDGLIKELGYWPSKSSFVREACLEKIIRELRNNKKKTDNPNQESEPAGEEPR